MLAATSLSVAIAMPGHGSSRPMNRSRVEGRLEQCPLLCPATHRPTANPIKQRVENCCLGRLQKKIVKFLETRDWQEGANRVSHAGGEACIVYDGKPSATGWPVFGRCKTVKAGYPKPAGHAPVQVTKRGMSCIFDDREASGGFLDRRHIRKLPEQVNRNNR